MSLTVRPQTMAEGAKRHVKGDRLCAGSHASCERGRERRKPE